MVEIGLRSLDEILLTPIIVIQSTEKDVMIYGVNSFHRKVDLRGYVQSESRNPLFHEVAVEYDPWSRRIIFASCTCESSKYFGDPCKHASKLRNVFVKNQSKLPL
jgi:hypothetical protein